MDITPFDGSTSARFSIKELNQHNPLSNPIIYMCQVEDEGETAKLSHHVDPKHMQICMSSLVPS